jgi:hypothetical protein
MSTTDFSDDVTVIPADWLNDVDKMAYDLSYSEPGIAYKTRQLLKDYSEVTVTNSTATGAVSANVNNGNVHHFTLTGNVVFSFTNPAVTTEASSLTLIITQDGTGSRTITWPTVYWADNGTEPNLTNTAGAVSILTFLTTDAGATWYGFLSGNNFATPP